MGWRPSLLVTSCFHAENGRLFGPLLEKVSVEIAGGLLQKPVLLAAPLAKWRKRNVCLRCLSRPFQ